MRTVRAMALAAMLAVSSGTTAFAGEGGSYAQPLRPSHEVVYGEGGSYAQPVRPTHEAVQGEGGSYWSPLDQGEIRDGEVWS